MTSPFSSLGLDFAALNAFGFDASGATSLFGANAVQQFLATSLGTTTAVVNNYETADLFTFASNLDNAFRSQGIDSNAQTNLSGIDALLQSNIGSGIADITFTTSPDGTLTTSIDGVAGTDTTVNIGDLLNTALEQAGLA